MVSGASFQNVIFSLRIILYIYLDFPELNTLFISHLWHFELRAKIVTNVSRESCTCSDSMDTTFLWHWHEVPFEHQLCLDTLLYTPMSKGHNQLASRAIRSAKTVSISYKFTFKFMCRLLHINKWIWFIVYVTCLENRWGAMPWITGNCLAVLVALSSKHVGAYKLYMSMIL